MPRKGTQIPYTRFKIRPKPPEKEQNEPKIESVQPTNPISIQTNPKIDQMEPNNNNRIPVVQKVEIEEPKPQPIQKTELKSQPIQKTEPKPQRDKLVDEMMQEVLNPRSFSLSKKSGLFDSNKKPLFRLGFN